MKKVRINNSITNILKSTIVAHLIACIVLLLLCIFFTHVFITYGMYSDDKSKMDLIFILVSLTITSMLYIVITVKTIIKRNDELRYNYQTKTIKYAEFSKEGITLCYNDNVMFKVAYRDIDEMKLILKFLETRSSYLYMDLLRIYGSLLCSIPLNGIDLQLKYNDNKVPESVTIHIPTNFTLLDKIFEIVHFSQYIPKFSYKSSVQHKYNLPKTLENAIESYKANNYKHTLRTFGYTIWAIPAFIITIILLFIALFFVGYLIVKWVI